MSASPEEALANARKILETSMSAWHNGVRYATLGIVPDLPRMLNAIDNADVNENDVILAGFPRSGNHWNFELLGDLLKQDLKDDQDDFIFRQMELMGDDVESRLQSLGTPKVLTSHLYLPRLPKKVVERKVKVVYSLRNPKDVLVSWYRLMSESKVADVGFHGTWEEFLEIHGTGELMWGSWFDNVLCAEKFMRENPDVPVYVMQYEKLKENPVQAIKSLCNFLGKPEADAEQLAHETSFKNMKAKREASHAASEKLFLKEDCAGLMVKGQVGLWKRHFTVAQSEKVDRMFREKMAGSKLAEMLKEYI